MAHLAFEDASKRKSDNTPCDTWVGPKYSENSLFINPALHADVRFDFTSVSNTIQWN